MISSVNPSQPSDVTYECPLFSARHRVEGALTRIRIGPFRLNFKSKRVVSMHPNAKINKKISCPEPDTNKETGRARILAHAQEIAKASQLSVQDRKQISRFIVNKHSPTSVKRMIRIGCSDYCAERFGLFHNRFPYTNEFYTLFGPALKALNYSYTLIPTEVPDSFSALVDPNSLPSHLSSLYDTPDYAIILTEERFGALNFTYPFSFEQLSFVVRKPSSRSSNDVIGFLIQPFNHHSWLAVISICLLFLLLHLAIQQTEKKLARKIFITSVLGEFLLEFAVGTICALYSAKLTATATKLGFLLDEPPTIEYLTSQVSAGKYILVISSISDFRFEFINSSVNDDVRNFREALAANKLLLVDSNKVVCDYIRKEEDHVYFTIDLAENILEFCYEHDEEIIYVEIPGQSVQMASFAVSNRFENLRRKLNELIIAGLYTAEYERNQRQYAEVQRARGRAIQAPSTDSDEIQTGDIDEAFWIYMLGFLLALAAFVGVENRMLFLHFYATIKYRFMFYKRSMRRKLAVL